MMNNESRLAAHEAGRSQHSRGAFSSAKVLVIVILAAMFDGFDGQLIGFVAPAIAADWQLPKAQFGLVFSVGLMGLIIGAVGVAPFADRFGRRNVVTFGACLVACFTLLTAFARTPLELALSRMLTGIGLGTLMPILVTIAHEAAPQRLKGVFVTMLVTAFPFGSFLGGLAVAWGLQHGSWRDVFMVSGIVATCFPGLFWRYLEPGLPVSRTGEAARNTTVLTLFRQKRWLMTALVWVLFFASLINIYSLNVWLPMLLERAGFAVSDAIRITASFGLGGTVGGVVLGLLSVRLGGGILFCAYVVAAAALVSLGMSGGSMTLTLVLATTFGAMILGGHVGNTVLAARIYPSVMSATGLGWAQGVGRIGCVIGPALIGLAVQQEFGNAVIFFGSAAFALLAAVAVAWLAALEKKHRPSGEHP